MLDNFSLGSTFSDRLPLIIAMCTLIIIIYIVIRILYWVVFKKSGVNPIYSVIPILNYIKLIDIAQLPKSMIILLFIPIANIIAICRIKYEVSIRFGKGLGFALLYVIFPIIALYLLLPSKVVYNKINQESIIEQTVVDEKTIDDEALKNFKPEILPGSVPFEERAVPYFEEKPIDLNVQLKTFELVDDKKQEASVTNSVKVDNETSEKSDGSNVVDITALLSTKAQTHQTKNDAVQNKKCPNCGTELESDLSMCFMCGENV